jgi:hypothetical protein
VEREDGPSLPGARIPFPRQTFAPGSVGKFFYLCSDSDVARPETLLTSQKLYTLLARIRCRKLLILDACRSGDVASNLTREGVPLLVFASCAATQQAFEPTPGYGKHSLFAQCLFDALGSGFETADANKDGVLDLRELASYVSKRLPEILRELAPEGKQTPVFYPALPPAPPFASAPRRK